MNCLKCTLLATLVVGSVPVAMGATHASSDSLEREASPTTTSGSPARAEVADGLRSTASSDTQATQRQPTRLPAGGQDVPASDRSGEHHRASWQSLLPGSIQ